MGGSVLHRRQWARVTCQRKMPSCFRLALRMDRVPTMQQCKKACCNRLEKKKIRRKKSCACHAPRPGSLPHAAASSTRLEFKESRQRQLFGPSNIDWGAFGFPLGGQHGETPASRSSTRRASLGSPQRGVLQKMTRNGLRCLGCASLSPYIQEDAQISLLGGVPGSATSSSPRAKLLQYLGWLRGRGNLTRAEAPNSAAASQRGWEEGAGKVLLLGCWLLPQPRAESSQEKAGGVPSSQGCPPVWEQPPGQRAPCQD